MFSVRQKLKFYIYIYVCVYVYTNSRTPLTRRWLYGSPIIRNGLVLRVNISIYFYGLKSSPFFKYTIIIIIIFLLHGLGRLTRSGIDALSSFAGASTVSSYSTFVVEGVSGVWWCPLFGGGWSSFVCIWVSRLVFQRSPVLFLWHRFLFHPVLCIL